jgi:hypothetical protein
MKTLVSLIGSALRTLLKAPATDEERSLLEGSEFIGEFNFRTDSFDCGTDPGGFYEDDL